MPKFAVEFKGTGRFVTVVDAPDPAAAATAVKAGDIDLLCLWTETLECDEALAVFEDGDA